MHVLHKLFVPHICPQQNNLHAITEENMKVHNTLNFTYRQELKNYFTFEIYIIHIILHYLILSLSLKSRLCTSLWCVSIID